MSVMRVRAPPAAGSVQMLPCRSTASVPPSGDTATDIDVPSRTVTSINAGGGTGAPLSDVTRPSTPIAIHRRRMAASEEQITSAILCMGGEPEGTYFCATDYEAQPNAKKLNKSTLDADRNVGSSAEALLNHGGRSLR